MTSRQSSFVRLRQASSRNQEKMLCQMASAVDQRITHLIQIWNVLRTRQSDFDYNGIDEEGKLPELFQLAVKSHPTEGLFRVTAEISY